MFSLNYVSNLPNWNKFNTKALFINFYNALTYDIASRHVHDEDLIDFLCFLIRNLLFFY